MSIIIFQENGFPMDLKEVVSRYMRQVPEVKQYCSRCLATKRWGGSVVLMVVDAAFTSIGLNYFQAVVPKVADFEEAYVKTGKITNLAELSSANVKGLRGIWKNKRSWEVARRAAAYLSEYSKAGKMSEREALREWARAASLKDWRRDPIGRIKGVGINTFQYLRMMGGVDTVMPDKIVKKVINGILKEAGKAPVEEDQAFIEEVHRLASLTGYKAIELCWMTWLVQSEGGEARGERYAELLSKI